MAGTPYSPRLRTALVLCGSGTAGAYQAGVLRALAESGVKVDVVAAHGMGVVTALAAAVDGGPRLWDPQGFWDAPSLRGAYRWRAGLRVAAWGLAVALAALLLPLLVLVVAAALYALSLLAGLVGLTGIAETLIHAYGGALDGLFHPPLLPTVVPRAIVLALLVVLGSLLVAFGRALRHDPARRRFRGAFWWRLLGAPLDPREPGAQAQRTLWQLVRGASTEPKPSRGDLGRRYVDLLSENIGQPGFHEILLAVHDVDGRRDLTAALVSPAYRAALAARRPSAGPREAETVDLAGPGRDLLADLLQGALCLPVASTPHVVPFPLDGYWRGEAHRLCDRPDLVFRLLDELAAIGVEQVILVGASPAPSVPYGLRTRPAALRGRMGEWLQSIETAVLDDAARAAEARFSGVFVVRPEHNPVGPFDFGGAYDEASDRHRSLRELLQQGQQDAYLQFVEPVVAAGERVEVV